MSEYMENNTLSPESGELKPKSTTAMISLIAGILGVTAVPFIGSIIAVLTGSIARKEIKESEGALAGDGMAQAGLILGWIGIGFTVLGICLGGVVILTSLCFMIFAVTETWGCLVPLLLGII